MAHLSATEVQYEREHIRQDQVPRIVASYATCLSLAYIAVVLRFVARRISRATLKADDLAISIALLFITGQIIVGSYLLHLGFGKHIILLHDQVAYGKGVVIIEVLYFIGAALVKFSALLLYRRLFGSSKRFEFWLCILAVFILCYSVAGVILSLLACNPFKKLWDINVPGSCLNAGLVATIFGVFNVFGDVAVVFIPLPLIWTLHMERKWKIQLIGIFLLGGFVCVCSLYRATVLNRLSRPDSTWADTEPGIWAVAEVCIGIVSASLPTLRPVYNVFVRGHHCSSYERRCSRCERFNNMPGRPSRLRFWTRWRGWEAEEFAGGDVRDAGGFREDVERVDGGGRVVRMELDNVRDTAPAPDGVYQRHD